MNTDIRIKTSFPNHPKTKKFIKTMGPLGGWMILKLWVFAAQNKSDGWLTNMDATDICVVMEFKGTPRQMLRALLDCPQAADSMKSCPGCDVCEKGKTRKRAGWLNKTKDGFFEIHDWQEHNPYAHASQFRIDRARKGGVARRERKIKQIVTGCYEQDQAVLEAGSSSAPVPVPVPVPAPIATTAAISIKGNGRGESVDAMGRPLKTFK